MTMKTTVFRHAAAVLAMAATGAVAQNFENVARLESGLIAQLGAGIGQPGGPVAPIDRRLKLASCPGAVAYDPPVLGAAAVRCAALGWRIRVPLVRLAQAQPQAAAGSQPQQALADIVIRRGDPVEVVAGGRYFSVSSQAIAEQDGRVGGRIRVRAAPKSPPMMVEVVGEGQVRIPGS